MKPQRIQRKRTRGWKMPENTISVTRPGRWGNPFKADQYVKLGKGGPGTMYMICLEEKYATADYIYIENNEQAVATYRRLLELYPPKDIAELRGKNLACFCREGEPCHGDVLLELANQ